MPDVSHMQQRTGLFLGPFVFCLLLLTDFPGLSPEGHRLSAIMAWVVLYWFFEPIPLPATALLGVTLAVVLGVGDVATVMAPFANPVIFLFLGSFILARSMEVHGLDQRIASYVTRRASASPIRVVLAFVLLTFVLSMWISNTATTAMMIPLVLGALGRMPSEGRERHPYAGFLILLVAFSASIGGIVTPVGTPPNLIGLGFIREELGRNIDFFQWMLLCLPIGIATLLVLIVSTRFWKRLPATMETPQAIPFRLSRGEINTMAVFFLAVFLWVIPGIASLLSLSDLASFFDKHLPESIVALIAAVLLFVLPTSWKDMTFTMTWKEARKIDWGTIILFAGGLCLGSLLFQTGVTDHLGRGIIEWLPWKSPDAILFMGIILAIVFSEAGSNTAAANILIPLIIGVSRAAGHDPLIPALGATLGASFGFMLPVSTPPNAIAYATGHIRIGQMVRHGILLDISGAIIIWLALTFLAPLVLGGS